MTQKEVQALISLLDDPDESIFIHVRQKLESLGNQAIPLLEHAYHHQSFGHLFHERAEDLMHFIQFSHTCEALSAWTDSQQPQLLDGWMIVSRFAYPDLPEETIRGFFSKMQKDIWLELHEDLTALEQVNILNHFVFEVYGFDANRQNFHDSSNSFINYVIEKRKGNPVALSMIYLILAESLNLPIEGINLPRHFVVAYTGEKNQKNQEPVLFYINPFSKGTVFSTHEIHDFLNEIGVAPMDEYFVPTHTRAIIYRVLNNLKYAYHAEGQQDKVQDIVKLQEILAGTFSDENNEESQGESETGF